MEYDKQLGAMRTIMETLSSLDEADRGSVLDWVNRQFGFTSETRRMGAKESGAVPSPTREGTVSVVAQKLGVSSARELLLAAAAHLTLFQNKDSFTKDELVACAKEARGWKVNYSNQMAFNIKRMADAGTLFERSRDVFSLSDVALADVEGRIGK